MLLDATAKQRVLLITPSPRLALPLVLLVLVLPALLF
jgi:hypothetical protein